MRNTIARIGMWLLLVYPIALFTMMAGNLTGDFVGFYAQSAWAGQFQVAAIPIMMFSPVLASLKTNLGKTDD